MTRHQTMPRRPGPILLSSHLAVSVGWLGLELSLLALGMTGLAVGDVESRRASILAAAVLGNYLYPLFSIGSLITGVLVALRGQWGLVRHWWVLGKLTTNLALVLGGNLVVLASVRDAAGRVRHGSDNIAGAASTVVGAMTLGLLLLLAATLIGRYKPRGLTPFRRRLRR
jgi:hypothetical protein